MKLNVALNLIETDDLSLKKAARTYGIPISTQHNNVHCLHQKSVGRGTAFTDEEELAFVKHIITLSDWGFPLDSTDIGYLANLYLARSTVSRETCLAQNGLSHFYKGDVITEFIGNLRETLKGCLQQTSIATMKQICLMTLVSNDVSSKEWSNTQKGWLMPPGVWLPLCTVPQQWVTYCPHILCTKLKVFGIAGCLEFVMVPSITSPRKAGLMQPASVIGSRVTLCQMCTIHSSGPIVLIGVNLSSHFCHSVLVLTEKQNIRFVCLPPHSTFLLQPLYVAFSVPWRELGG